MLLAVSRASRVDHTRPLEKIAMSIKDISYIGDVYSRYRMHASTPMNAVLDLSE